MRLRAGSQAHAHHHRKHGHLATGGWDDFHHRHHDSDDSHARYQRPVAIVPPATTPTAREVSQPNVPTQAGDAWRLRACDVLFLWDVAAVTFTHRGTVLKPQSAIDSGECSRRRCEFAFHLSLPAWSCVVVRFVQVGLTDHARAMGADRPTRFVYATAVERRKRRTTKTRRAKRLRPRERPSWHGHVGRPPGRGRRDLAGGRVRHEDRSGLRRAVARQFGARRVYVSD